jgi:heme A synthase
VDSVPSSRRFTRFAWATLALNVAVVLWGALVRATGSGAGCGNSWPRCNGEVIPTSPTIHTVIEFTHRLMTGADAPMVLLLVIWAFRAFPKRHPVRLAALLSGIFLVSEALIGAGLVIFDQVGRNVSPSRGWWLSGHLFNTLTLLAVLALTAWWSGDRPLPRFSGMQAAAAGVSLGSFMVLGISGAIAALGDTLYPAQSLAAGLTQDLDPSAHLWLRLRVFHPVIAAAVAMWLLFYALSRAMQRPELRPRAYLLLGLVAAQIAAGGINLVLLAPLGMQILHLLLADLVWIALVIFCAQALAESQLAAPEPVPQLSYPAKQ